MMLELTAGITQLTRTD